MLLCPSLAAAARYAILTDLHTQICWCADPTTVYNQLTLAVSCLFRPLEEQQLQHVAPAGLDFKLTALAVLIEHFVFACGYDCAVLMLSEHPAGRRLQQVFSQASGTGGFVDTMTSGSFNVSFPCGNLRQFVYSMCCSLPSEVSIAIVFPAASIQQLISPLEDLPCVLQD